MHVNKMQQQFKNIKKIDKDYFEYAKGFLKLIVIVQFNLVHHHDLKTKLRVKEKHEPLRIISLK
jgi:hypothetical protein